jgi:hypothetical protein
MTMLNKPRQNDDETRSASWPTDGGHRGNRMSLETATLLAACLSGFLFQVDLTALAAAYPTLAATSVPLPHERPGSSTSTALL